MRRRPWGRQTREELSRLVELERGQLGHDLHDDLIPLLFVARASAERLASLGTPQAAELQQLASWLDEAMQCTRRLLGNLPTPDFCSESWVQRVTDTVRAMIADGLELNWDVDAPLESLPDSLAIPAYRITVEAIRNAFRHGKAKRIAITGRIMSDSSHGLPHGSITIADDGRGFDLSDAVENHYGLLIMRSRAQLAGGSLAVHSRPSESTSVEFTF